MKRLLTTTLLVGLLAMSVLAQQSTPSTSNAPTTQSGTSIPNDFSGMYSFLEDGEFLQINLEGPGTVTGFISRYGDLDSDKGAFLDQFIKTGKTDGKKIDFTTDAVHGTWWEFHGNVGRGQGKTPNDDAYYVIAGKLTKYSTDAAKKTTAQAREVTLKSFPQDAGMTPAKRE